MTDAEIARLAAGLSDLERELLTDRADTWGSWMWGVGSDLVRKGLGTRCPGSIQFDTPLGLAVRAHILAQSASRGGGGK